MGQTPEWRQAGKLPSPRLIMPKGGSKMAQRAAVSAAKHNDLRDPRWNEKSNV